MKHVYVGALDLIQRRIEQCGRALQHETEAFSISRWQLELAKANHTKMRILKRLKADHNVVFVDFKAKRKAA